MLRGAGVRLQHTLVGGLCRRPKRHRDPIDHSAFSSVPDPLRSGADHTRSARCPQQRPVAVQRGPLVALVGVLFMRPDTAS